MRAPVLTGWASGPIAAKYLAESREFILHAATDALARLLRIDRGRLDDLLEAWYVHEWHRDPFCRGAYSYVPVGALGAREILAAPVENTLYFAGEAAVIGANDGTVHGAIASGERAASLILSARS